MHIICRGGCLVKCKKEENFPETSACGEGKTQILVEGLNAEYKEGPPNTNRGKGVAKIGTD